MQEGGISDVAVERDMNLMAWREVLKLHRLKEWE